MGTRTPIDRFYSFIGWSGICILAGAFLLTFLGLIDIRIYVYKDLNFAIEVIANFCLMFLNMLAIFLFCTEFKLNKALISALIITTICELLCLIIPRNLGFVVTMVTPLLLTFTFSNFKIHVAFMLLIFSLIVLPYQVVFAYIKTHTINLNFMRLNSITTFILSMDLLLLYGYLIKRKEQFTYEAFKRYSRLVGKLLRDFSRRKQLYESNKVCEENYEQSSEVEIDEDEKIKRIIKIVYFTFQIIVILAINHFYGTLIQACIMLTLFIIGRPILGVSWHSEELLLLCFAISTFSFYAMPQVTMPLEISLFMTIVAIAIFTYVFHVQGVRKEEYRSLQQEKQKLEEMVTPENTLEATCRELGLNHRYIEICIGWQLYGESRKDQAIKYNYPEDTIRTYRNTISRTFRENNKTLPKK